MHGIFEFVIERLDGTGLTRDMHSRLEFDMESCLM